MPFKIFILSLLLITGIAQADQFDVYFEPTTMRLDYFHTGNHQTELYSFDEVYQESVWAGSRTQLIDHTNFGKYLFQIFDDASDSLIYSRGFCSIFGEWQTTEEAKKIDRSFSESLRFPWPKAPVKVTISSRDKNNVFCENWSITLNPKEVNYIRSQTFSQFKSTPLFIHGDPQKKVDIVILPDGYTQKEMKKFHQDARRLFKVLFSVEPFKSNMKNFNVRTVDIPSNEHGIDDPQKNVYKDNALDCSFNAFGSDRYILTWNNKTLRKVASRVPYDHLYILINSKKYGGGGIFNLYSTCISDNRWSDYIFVHEFGHSFSGLGDEYYTSDTAYDEFYPIDIEPWEPNITIGATRDQAKWKDLIPSDVPIPTPWNKETYDANQREFIKKRDELKNQKGPQAVIDSLTAANDQWVHDFLRNQPYWGKIGVFEGSGYASSDLYRPFLDCRMFTRSLTGFDPVCSRAIEQVIWLYSK